MENGTRNNYYTDINEKCRENDITVQNNDTAYFSDDYLEYNSRYSRLLYALQSINHWYNVQENKSPAVCTNFCYFLIWFR